jgi:UDP-N-acetylglucosamine:LPS N-acetylglucosamine transferase
MEQVARALAASRQPVSLVVVCGHNARLRRRLTRALGARATVLGWCDDRTLAALTRWSSVVVTRGGPTTLVEALSQARPVVIYQALPGQEQGNVTLIRRLGAGRYIPDVAALVRAVTLRLGTQSAGTASEALWKGGAQRVVARLVLAQVRR